MDITGCIGFSTCESFVSRSIRYFTGGVWSHTFLCIGNMRGKDLILEASTYEVRVAPLDRFMNATSKIAIVKPALPDWYMHLAKIDEAINLVGKPYGYVQLVGYIWPWLLHRVGIKASNPFHDGVVCSELVGAEQKEAGYALLKDAKINDITPDSLWFNYLEDKVSQVVATKDYGTSKIKYIQGT